MPVAAGFALELEVGEDIEGLSSCHRVMFVASKTSRMRFRASQSMPGAPGLTVALETTDDVGDTDIGKTR